MIERLNSDGKILLTEGGFMKRRKILLVLLILLPLLVCVSTGQAKPFYQGKVMKIIVTTKPGGGYDFYGRMMARFMQKYLPGSTIITKNIPGGGHLIGTNTIYKAKPDGLTFGTFNRAVGTMQVIGLRGVRFDFPKMSWLGSASSELYSFVVQGKKYKNLDDVLNEKNTRLATSGKGGMNHITAVMFHYMMKNDNYTIGTGYEGGETNLAIMRGEMDGAFGSFNSRKQMVDDGYGRIVMYIGSKRMLAIVAQGYEGPPFIQDVVKDPKFKPAIGFLVGMQDIGRPFAGPPGIPKDRLKILRTAFNKALADPQLKKFAKKAERPVGLVPAKEVTAWAKGMFELPPDVVKVIKGSFGM
jgi:tripartite-type tricarboxylate transporter receptor subunit TctC